MAALEPGAAAPKFALSDAAGQTHTLAEGLAQGPVTLVFFKISCPTCQYALPFFERLQQRLGGAPGSLWGISQDSLDQTDAFAREFGVRTLPMLFDPEEQGYPVSNAYGITTVPTAFLIEQGGRIALTSVGWSRDEAAAIATRLGEASRKPALTLYEPREDVLAFRPG
jgi:peroxiredoxin